jgi:5-formyltetrahydrofolate cyclo-ligase
MARDGTCGWRHPLFFPPSSPMAQSTAEVRDARRRLRRLRASLGRAERIAAERAIIGSLERLNLFRRGARVALYLPIPGEVDLRPAIESAWRRGSEVYMPKIVNRRRGRMAFLPWTPDQPRRRNVYGIEEPTLDSGRLEARQLDTVVLPVVGFDRDGRRLGMGAGFYDRAMRRRLDQSRVWRRPRLVGVAFSCQELPSIPDSPWDVPLDLIVTESGVLVPQRRSHRSAEP